MVDLLLRLLKLAVLHGPDLVPQFAQHGRPPGLLLEKHCELYREKATTYSKAHLIPQRHGPDRPRTIDLAQTFTALTTV